MEEFTYLNWKIEKSYAHTIKGGHEYSQVAKWCNENNCMFKEVVEEGIAYYKVVPVPPPAQPTEDEKAQQEISKSKAKLDSNDYQTIRLMERYLRAADLTSLPELKKERDSLLPVWDEKEKLRESINNNEAKLTI